VCILTVPLGKQSTIIASAPGYAADTLRYNPSGSYEFVLTPEPIILAPIAVTGKRISEAYHSTAFVASLFPMETAGATSTVPEMLGEVVGVQVQSTGGHGSFSTVSIRSSSSEQVRVYLDGIPLNQALGGGVNLAAIPLSVVERVDVYRGIIPPSFGGSGIAGVVNFTTRQPTDSLRWRTAISYGTWDTRASSAWLTRRIGPVAGIASVDYTHSDNDFKFLDDNGTTLNLSDDTWAQRTNNQFSAINTLLRLSSLANSPVRWTASYCFLHTNNHLPGNSAYHELPNTTRFVSDQHLAEAMVGFPLPFLSEIETHAYHSFRRDRFENREGLVGLGRSLTDDTASVWGAQVTMATLYVPAQRLTVFGSATRETYRPNDAFIVEAALREKLLRPSGRTQYSAFLSNEAAFFDRRILLTGNLGLLDVRNTLLRDETASRNWVDSSQAKAYPRAVGFVASPANWFSIRGNWGEYTRVPNLYELFGNRGSSVGNSLLLPEKGVNRDIGLSLTAEDPLSVFAGCKAELVYFDNDVSDLIAFWTVYNRMKPFNIGGARIRGIEASGTFHTAFGLSSSFSGTWQIPRNESTLYGGLYFGNDLPHRPRWQADLRSEYAWRAFTFSYGFHFHNRFYGQPVNNIADLIPSAFLHDVGIQVRPARFLTVSLEAKNLTNVREFHSRYVPLPGRSFFVSIHTSSR
jgi:iron complex outermembrane receptor protein